MIITYSNNTLTIQFNEPDEQECMNWCLNVYTIQIFHTLMLNFLKGREAQKLDTDKQNLYTLATKNPVIRAEAEVAGIVIKEDKKDK